MRPITSNAPKCLTEVSGDPILNRLLDNLRVNGITRLVIVVGYLEGKIRRYLVLNAPDIQVDYVLNPDYQTTNNIYSLWLARNVIDEPFVLIESDLVFDAPMLTPMLSPGKIAVSDILPWMNGTVVELDAEDSVAAFHVSHDADDAKRYKTVNIYSLSTHDWAEVIKRLDKYVLHNRVNEYYETVFAEMVSEGSLEFDAVFFDESRWYEIDRVEDLDQAELMFPYVPDSITAENVVIGRIVPHTPVTLVSTESATTTERTHKVLPFVSTEPETTP